MSLDLKQIAGLILCDPDMDQPLRVLRNGEITLGRAQDNDLTLAHQTVSAHHAKIYTYLTASYIEDLNSTNGTFINGKRVSKHVLKADDVIRLGAYALVLKEPAQLMETVAEESRAAG